jgi:hypothetical protein
VHSDELPINVEFRSDWANLCTLKIKSISPSIAKKEMTTKYLAKFQNPRAITRPKIIGPEQNVQLICNSSLYIHKPLGFAIWFSPDTPA